MEREPLEPAIERFCDTFPDALKVIYDQIGDDKYMKMINKCRNVPQPRPPPVQEEEEEKQPPRR